MELLAMLCSILTTRGDLRGRITAGCINHMQTKGKATNCTIILDP